MLLTDDVHAPRFRIDWHTHPHAGCTFTVRGGYRERNAAAEFACEPGMWMLKPAEARHINQYGAEATRSLHLMFLRGERPEVDRGIGRHLGVALLQGGPAPRIGRRLVRELSMDDDATPLSVEALLLELSAQLCREGGPTNPRWVGLAREAIDARFREPLRLSGLAADLGAEPAELARGFRNTFGETPGAYLRRRRIEWADRQLKEGVLSIDRIALEAGFYDRSHFIRVFTRVLGRRPVRLREVDP